MAWKTAALLVAFCAFNALRKNVNSRLLWEEPARPASAQLDGSSPSDDIYA